MPYCHRNERFRKACPLRRERNGCQHIRIVEIFVGKSSKQRFDIFFGLFCFVVTNKKRADDVIDRYLSHAFLNGKQSLRKHSLSHAYFGFVVPHAHASGERMLNIKLHTGQLRFRRVRLFLFCLRFRIFGIFFYRFEKHRGVFFKL